jgi:hypothetical protein
VAIAAGIAAGLAALAALGLLCLACRRRNAGPKNGEMVMVSPMMSSGMQMQMPSPPGSYGNPAYGHPPMDAGYSVVSTSTTSTQQQVNYRM